ncbi:MAG: hypothetical protein J0G32_07220 [Alphaproteobacteria bacterium]|nr:hypothetical protein [Alphaproteobacteria bacterium]OJV13526.1 MAG: hypothetical protein BGO27_04900 [Alphaproteobacteria bacterium 33-17]
MPQLDISTYFSQLFWLLLTFGMLYGFMSYVFLPKLAKVINKRNDQIESLLEKAEQMRIKAADIDYEISHEIEKIKAETKKKLDEQIEIFNKKYSQEMMKLEIELSDKTHLAESRANEYKLRSAIDTEKTIIAAVKSMYAVLINKELSDQEAEKYVKSAAFDINKQV